jgi:anti-anti-sigma regulatory factor
MRRKTKVKRNSNQPKIVLRLPDLEHAKSAVLNSLTSVSQAMRGGDPTVMLSMSSSIGIVQNLGLLSIER